MFIDTHAHLYYHDFDADRTAVIRRAVEHGVQAIITIGVDVASSRQSVLLAQKYPSVFAAVGIHPTDCADTTGADILQIRELAEQHKVVAIGEVGLDYYHMRAPKDKQKQIFVRQIHLAKELCLPLIIHNRDAHGDMLEILEAEKVGEAGGVLHSFSGEADYLEQALRLGLHVSFTGVVTFKNYKHAFLVDQTPIDRLLLETDCPFMTPDPQRGKRNEPAYLKFTAQKIAEIKGMSLEDLAEKTSGNARQLFKLS